MGQAFHRKQLSSGRGARTPGIGIYYEDRTPLPAVRHLTTEEIAAKEADSQRQTILLGEQWRLRQKHVDDAVKICERVLCLWKQAMDYNDRRVIEFPGWTTGSCCALPLESHDIARDLAEEFQRCSSRRGRPLSLDEMDNIVNSIRSERAVSTEQVVEAAIKIIRRTVEEHCNHDGILMEPFVRKLTKCAVRAKDHNIDLDSALFFVSKRLMPAVTVKGIHASQELETGPVASRSKETE